jgi:hypothetical protein
MQHLPAVYLPTAGVEQMDPNAEVFPNPQFKEQLALWQ